MTHSTGRWLPDARQSHRCELPKLAPGWPRPSNRWQCDCGLVWHVDSVSQHGETWEQWRRVL